MGGGAAQACSAASRYRRPSGEKQKFLTVVCAWKSVSQCGLGRNVQVLPALKGLVHLGKLHLAVDRLSSRGFAGGHV